MEELLASSSIKQFQVSRNQEVEGEVVAILDKEIILDLGSKSEGVIGKRELSDDQVKRLRVGDKLKAYVAQTESESGQIILSSTIKQPLRGNRRGTPSLNRFINAKSAKSIIKGKIAEVNKGGFLIETEGIRGFMPNSQVGYEIISKIKNNDNGYGAEVNVLVSEVDEANQRLIFTQKRLAKKEDIDILKQFSKDQNINVEVVTALPFGLIVKAENINAIVFSNELSWEKIEDPSAVYKTGQILEAKILGLDEEFGRVNLSVKQLQEDPFKALTDKYPTDEVVKGEVTQVGDTGIVVALDGVEGFLPAEKMDSSVIYELGKSMTFLVDGIDTHKRRVNLAPFITSTAGLIYK